MSKPRIILIVVVALVAVAAGYWLGPARQQATPGQATTAAAGAAAQLLATTLNDADGRPQAIAQWRGKILVVNFWATWCPPCRQEMPGFAALQQKHESRGVQFLGIAVDSADNVREFAESSPTIYPLLVALPETIDVARALGNADVALPFTVVLDRRGTPRFAHLGRLDEAALETEILPLLAE